MRPVAIAMALWMAAVVEPSPSPAAPESAAASPSARSARPNVILITLDTLRADHLGLYGYERDTSPHLDALAKESVVFDHAVAQASWTRPSHRSLFTSRLPSRVGAAPRLPSLFKDAGYETAAFTGGVNMSAKFGFGDGFTTYEESLRGWTQSFPRVEAWLRSRTSAPFFLFVQTYDIHLPYSPPAPDRDRYFPEYDGKITGAKTSELLKKMRRRAPYRDFRGDIELSDDDRKKIVALYDGGIRFADRWLGELVSLLKELGLWDDSMLVVLSDHGEEFWDHGKVLHGFTLYEEMLHVPLLIRLPGGEHAGARIAPTVRLLDVAPTIAEVCGLAPPDTFQGTSLLPLIRGGDAPHPPAVAESNGLRSWEEGGWKLVWNTRHPNERRPEMALYDLRNDPEERRNLVDAHPDRARALRAKLEAAFAGLPVEPEGDPEIEKVDPKLRKQLEALGYVD